MLSCLNTQRNTLRIAILVALGGLAQGCNSPYRSDQGALYGGLGGAGLGAIVGNAVGNTGAGLATDMDQPKGGARRTGVPWAGATGRQTREQAELEPWGCPQGRRTGLGDRCAFPMKKSATVVTGCGPFATWDFRAGRDHTGKCGLFLTALRR